MEISAVEKLLEDNGITEVEELKSNDEYLIVKFYYDFDNDELEAARAYADEESDLESESLEWYKDWYLPYLTDIANDNVEEILEEISEELEVITHSKALEMRDNSADYIKFIAILSKDELDDDIEDILNDYL